MIATVAKARMKGCPEYKDQPYLRESNGMCVGPGCMAWCYWIPPPGIKETPHGIKDVDKKGYCGKVGTHK